MTEAARRRNPLLSSYYDLPQSPTAAHGRGSGSQETASATLSGSSLRVAASLGQDASSARNYARGLIESEDLARLLDESIRLRRDAREVEIGLHRAVRQAFTALNAATNLISQVSQSADAVSSHDLGDVASTVGRVTSKTHTINQDLAQGRERVERLEGARRAIQLLRLARAAPDWLRALDKAGESLRAARSFQALSFVLRGVRDVHPAFFSVAEEVDRVAADIMANANASAAGAAPGTAQIPAASTLQILRALGQPQDSVRDDFLRTIAHNADNIIGSSQASFDDRDMSGVQKAIRLFSEARDVLLPYAVEAYKTHDQVFFDCRQQFSEWIVNLFDSLVGLKTRELIRQTPVVEDDVEEIASFIEVVKSFKLATSAAFKSEEPFDSLNVGHAVDVISDGVLSEAHASVVSSVDDAIQNLLADLWNDAERTSDPALLDQRIRGFRDSIYSAVRKSRAAARTLQAALVQQANNDPVRPNIDEGVKLAAVHVLDLLRRAGTASKPSSNLILLISAKVCSELSVDENFRCGHPEQAQGLLVDRYIDSCTRTLCAEFASMRDRVSEAGLGGTIREVRGELGVCFSSNREQIGPDVRGGATGVEEELHQLFGREKIYGSSLDAEHVLRGLVDQVTNTLTEHVRCQTALSDNVADRLVNAVTTMASECTAMVAAWAPGSSVLGIEGSFQSLVGAIQLRRE